MDPGPDSLHSPFKCPFCKEDVSPRDEECRKCGYPLKGTEDDQNAFRAQRTLYLSAKYTQRKKVWFARNILLFLSIILFFLGIAGLIVRDSTDVDWVPMVINFLGSAVFLFIAALFARKNPIPCFIAGIVVIIASYIAFNIYNDRSFSLTFLLVVIIFLWILGRGISGVQAEKNIDRGYDGIKL